MLKIIPIIFGGIAIILYLCSVIQEDKSTSLRVYKLQRLTRLRSFES